KLIEEPMRIPEDDPLRPGQSRFQGPAGAAAVARLIELTAGNPYFLQGLCSRLVQYMNRHRAILATDVYVEAVKRQAVAVSSADERVQRLGKDYFNSLLTSKDPSADAITEDDAYAVLSLIARESRNQTDCQGEKILAAATTSPVPVILADLCRRDV